MEPAPLILTVLGCDGSYPGPGGACSGYLVESGDTAVVLDLGSGTMAHLQEHLPIEKLDAVIITHSHPDHWTDLEVMAIAFKWGLKSPGPRVYAPDGLRQLMRVGDAAEVFEWTTIDDGMSIEEGSISLAFSRTDHPVPTLAVRVDAGRRALGYSADSGPGWALSSLGYGLDVALCEATFLSDKEGSVQHMSARQAGLAALEAGAERLVITHLAPGVDRSAARAEAEETFRSTVQVAALGARYEV